METSMGNMTIALFDKEAPITCKNFRTYVRDGFFDGLIFHRVIPGFMIQGGGFEPGLKKKSTRPPIMNEAHNGLKNKRGTLSMARTQDINSATAQFFINVNDNRSLDHRSMRMDGYGYAVFGKVVEGMDVADAIVSVPRGQSGMYGDVPNKDVVILKMYEEKK
ncbi:MAG: peptidylprolyl isomerase [Thermodesulfobacteriota bacterium]